MTKKAAIDFFGSVNLTADACGRSAQAIDKWPHTLSDSQKGLVLLSAIRLRGWARAKDAFGSNLGRR